MAINKVEFTTNATVQQIVKFIELMEYGIKPECFIENLHITEVGDGNTDS